MRKLTLAALSGALLVMTAYGVMRAQGFKRLPKEQAWDSLD